jgi:hypothetical protein
MLLSAEPLRIYYSFTRLMCARSWRAALEARLEEVREKHADAFKGAVEKKLRERLVAE